MNVKKKRVSIHIAWIGNMDLYLLWSQIIVLVTKYKIFSSGIVVYI